MDVVDKAQAVIPPERYAKRVRPTAKPHGRLLAGHRAEWRGVLGAGAILPREKQTAAEVLHRTQPESKVRHGRDGAHHLQYALDAGDPPPSLPPPSLSLPSSAPPRPPPSPHSPPPPRVGLLGTNAAFPPASQLMTDPILSKKLVDDRLANRTNSNDGLTFEQANADGLTYDPASVQMLGREFAAQEHHWASVYRPFYAGCELGKLPPCRWAHAVDKGASHESRVCAGGKGWRGWGRRAPSAAHVCETMHEEPLGDDLDDHLDGEGDEEDELDRLARTATHSVVRG